MKKILICRCQECARGVSPLRTLPKPVIADSQRTYSWAKQIFKAVRHRCAMTGSKKNKHKVGPNRPFLPGVMLFTQLSDFQIALSKTDLRYWLIAATVALILVLKKDFISKTFLNNKLSQNNKYEGMPLFQSKSHVLQGVLNHTLRVIHGIKREKEGFGGRDHMSCTLEKAESKIKEMGNIVGSSLSVTHFLTEIATQAQSTGWVIQQSIIRLNRVSEIVESEHETYSDEKIEELKSILSDVSKLIQAIERTYCLSPELKLIEKLYSSCSHMADVLADAVECRNITSEISIERANPSINRIELEDVEAIIEEGKKLARQSKSN